MEGPVLGWCKLQWLRWHPQSSVSCLDSLCAQQTPSGGVEHHAGFHAWQTDGPSWSVLAQRIKQYIFFLRVSRLISFSKKQSDQDEWRTVKSTPDSHTALGKAGQISLKKSQVFKPPHHLSSPTEGWQSYQALNKTECEIRRAKVLHTSHVKTNLYIQTL